MGKRIYTDEHIEYLRQISPGRYNDEVTQLFNQKFGMNLTETAIKSIRQRYGIKLTVPRARKGYTDDQMAYLKELSSQGLFNAEITRLFNEKFGTNKTENAIQNIRTKYGIKTTARHSFPKGNVPWNKGMKGWKAPGTERTQFKKGNIPQTYLPIGTEVVDSDGYVKVKIADPNKWEYKHRLIWEKHHGRPVPPGHAVIFGDGDKRNLDPDNLLLVSRAQLVRINQSGLIKNDARLTKTGVLIADLMNKIGELSKKKNEKEPGHEAT